MRIYKANDLTNVALEKIKTIEHYVRPSYIWLSKLRK